MNEPFSSYYKSTCRLLKIDQIITMWLVTKLFLTLCLDKPPSAFFSSLNSWPLIFLFKNRFYFFSPYLYFRILNLYISIENLFCIPPFIYGETLPYPPFLLTKTKKSYILVNHDKIIRLISVCKTILIFNQILFNIVRYSSCIDNLVLILIFSTKKPFFTFTNEEHQTTINFQK